MNKFWLKKTPPQVNLQNAEVAEVEFKRRHWKYAALEGPTLPLRNSPEPFHKVTHRAIGDIPGCTPAPREGIHRSEPLDEIKRKLHWRIIKFNAANGINNRAEKEGHFRGDSYIEPLYGAYGEQL